MHLKFHVECVSRYQVWMAEMKEIDGEWVFERATVTREVEATPRFGGVFQEWI